MMSSTVRGALPPTLPLPFAPKSLSRGISTISTRCPNSPVLVAKLYERRYPPVPKLNTTYTQAKRAEYDGDFELALRLYARAIRENDRPESAIKDYAGLLHMRGNTKEAIVFMEAQGARFVCASGYQNLLKQMREALDRVAGDVRDLSRTILVAVDASSATQIDFSSLPTMFPNSLKICRLVFINPNSDTSGNFVARSVRALVEFASHSAARKALMINKHESIKCFWAPKDLIVCASLLERPATRLVPGGPTVTVQCAHVDPEVVENEWPKQLLGSSQQPHTSSPSLSTASSPLSLPIRRAGDALSDDDPTGECVCIEWCLDTPSPVRHLVAFDM